MSSNSVESYLAWATLASWLPCWRLLQLWLPEAWPSLGPWQLRCSLCRWRRRRKWRWGLPRNCCLLPATASASWPVCTRRGTYRYIAQWLEPKNSNHFFNFIYKSDPLLGDGDWLNGYSVGLEIQKTPPTEVRTPSGAQEKLVSLFPSQKCWADLLSVCPTYRVCICTHKNDHYFLTDISSAFLFGATSTLKDPVTC